MEYFNIGLHHLHNFLRWGVLISGLWAIYLAYSGMRSQRAWNKADNQSGKWFILFCHLQLLTGLILYFYLGQHSIFSNMAEGMKNAETRYWGVEHFLGMLIAVALIQYGRIASKKAVNDLLKFKKALIWYSVGILLIIFNIPWPWKEIGRSIFPGL